MKTKIISSGHYVPEEIITNDDLSKIVETNDEWIYTRTGIKERRRAASDELVSDLAYKAVIDAVNKANYDISKIDLIVVATIKGDQITPSTANVLQGKLGIKEAMSFDINAACTGFVYALETATALLKAGSHQAALVVGVERLTDITDYTDRQTCILFGDGAGAVIVEKTADNDGDNNVFYNAAAFDENEYLTVNQYIKMDGRRVYLFAVDIIEKSIRKILEDNKISLDEIDIIIPHQANERIIQGVAKAMDLSMDKFFMNIAKYGNTSAASIPITISEYREEFGANKKILIVGFGGGFTWGSAIITT